MEERDDKVTTSSTVIEPKIHMKPHKENSMLQISSVHVGPIPPADELAKYEKACKGAASRILAMAEKEANERYLANDKVLDAAIRDSRRGMYMAFFLAALLILCGYGLLLIDQYISGTMFSVSGLSIVLKAFIDSNYDQDKGE